MTRIGFIGAGRVGTALAIAFSRAGWAQWKPGGSIP